MAYTFSTKPSGRLIFGATRLSELAHLIEPYGSRILLITGEQSFTATRPWQQLQPLLHERGIHYELERISGEPSPDTIDTLVSRHAPHHPDAVVAIGGGSVLDGGKAVAAMLAEGGSVKRLLEGVGNEKPQGKTHPFLAVPTTAGTGSEATSNAVLSEVGPAGYKKSLRHDNYIPAIALVDPALTLDCSSELTARCGMDAFSQLLEAYLSTNGSPLTDALALEGIHGVQRSLRRTVQDGSNLEARTDMAYSAYLSGVVLTNAGLGTVHGFASVIGGLLPIPHGVVCGTLMAAANRATLDRLRATGEHPGALAKYATLGRLFSDSGKHSDSYLQDAFIATLENYTEEFAIPRLSEYGMSVDHIDKIVQMSVNKYNPATLSKAELHAVLRSRIAT